MISYWEREALSQFDLVVIGGGIVGNFTALEYAKANPNAKIAILERGFFPEGASTKNAGLPASAPSQSWNTILKP